MQKAFFLVTLVTLMLFIGCGDQYKLNEKQETENEAELENQTEAEESEQTLDDSVYALTLQAGEKAGYLTVQWVNQTEEEMEFFIQNTEEENEQIIEPQLSYHEGNKLFTYKASIEGLEPETRYRYGIRNKDGAACSYYYTTPEYGDEFQFLFMGDPQIREDYTQEDIEAWKSTIKTALGQFPFSSFVISAGDQVDTPSEEAYQQVAAPEELKKIPLVVNRGNHDASSTLYESYYSMPSQADTGDFFYQYGKTLFVGINSNVGDFGKHEEFISHAKEQYLEENEEEEEWLILMLHHSLYSVGDHAGDESILEQRAEYSTIFSDFDVDLVLMGHDHRYTRSYFMNNEEPRIEEKPYGSDRKQKSEVLYITAGTSTGSKFYERFAGDTSYAAAESEEQEAQFSSIFIDQAQIIIKTYATDDLSLIDEFSISK